MAKVIRFNDVPDGILVSGTYGEMDTSAVMSGKPSLIQNVLIMGYCQNPDDNQGTGKIYRLFSPDGAKKQFGKRSMLYRQAVLMFKQYKYICLYAYSIPRTALNWAASTARVVNIDFQVTTGDVSYAAETFNTQAGKLTVYVGSTAYTISYEANASVDDITTALAAKINADETALWTAETIPYAAAVEAPVTAAVAGKVRLTFINKDSLDNQFEIIETHDIAGAGNLGFAAAISNTNGVNTEAQATLIENILTDVSAYRWHKVVVPWCDSITLAKARDWMISQSGSIEKKAGIIVAATNGQCNMYNTVGEAMVMGPNLSTAATNGSTLSSGTNDQLKRILYAFYPHCPAADFEIAAVLAAAFASHTNPNHHFDSEILLNIPAPFDLNNWMLFTEMQTLLVNGVTPIEVLTGGVSAINRAVLCNTENADVFDICNCTTLDFLRDWVLKLRHDRYPQVNMDDDTLEALTSDVVGLLYNGQNDYDPKLFDQVDRYKDAVIITRDAAGRANLAVPVAVVPGLHVLAFQLQLIPLE